MESAQTLLEYEANEDEKITAALMRKELTAAIRDLRTSQAADARADLKRHQESLDTLKDTEDTLKELKRKLEQNQFDLEVKLGLKKFGPEEETWDARRLAEQAGRELAALEAETEQDKEKRAKARRLRGDIATLERRIEAIERLSDSIGGVITGPEAKELILRKHHDLVADQLNRYLSAEKRAMLNVLENLWAKYATDAATMKSQHKKTNQTLDDILQKLSYMS